MTEAEQREVWRRQIAECDTLRDFNRYCVPVMRYEPQFRLMAAAEAKQRGWKADKEKGCYVERMD